MDYLYSDVIDCADAGVHLSDCDENGYCNLCGDPDSPLIGALRVTVRRKASADMSENDNDAETAEVAELCKAAPTARVEVWSIDGVLLYVAQGDA